MPDEHKEQPVLLEDGEYSPGPQFEHSEFVVPLEAVPEPHMLNAVLPVPLQYFPALQFKHAK